MERKPHPNDLTDAQWRLIAPLIPDAKPGGRPRKSEMRKVVNALLYLTREGCSWRALPHDLPHGKTCYNLFRRFEAGGTWDALVAALRLEVRSRPRPPAAGSRSGWTAARWSAGGSGTSSPTRWACCWSSPQPTPTSVRPPRDS